MQNYGLKLNIYAFFIIGLFLLFTNNTVSQNIKFSPIKPEIKTASTITDEQQGIFAVRKAKASVVSVVSYVKKQSGSSLPPTVEINYGTGFVWDSQGTVVTNSHVVDKPGATYGIILADGTEYPAEMGGLDKYNDVAMLKANINNLSVATIGESENLETGQSVFVIGYSLGKYQSSVTRGVVSGLGRMVTAPSGSQLENNPRYANLIQTDAAINPGNSGGPLINMLGEVVGMSTIVDRNGEGLGFAVPTSVIKFSIDQLRQFGKVSRAYMGVQFVTVNKAIKIQNNLEQNEGALITGVNRGSPANTVDIRIGDVITEINGIKLNQYNELDSLLQEYQSGMQVLITLMRGKEKLQLPLILGEYK